MRPCRSLIPRNYYCSSWSVAVKSVHGWIPSIAGLLLVWTASRCPLTTTRPLLADTVAISSSVAAYSKQDTHTGSLTHGVHYSYFCTSVNTQQWAQPVTAGVHGVSSRKCQLDDDDDDDDDESISYVRPLLQLQTVTNVPMIHSDEQFSFQIATERGWKVAAV